MPLREVVCQLVVGQISRANGKHRYAGPVTVIEFGDEEGIHHGPALA